jgi:hypothetical protein
MLSIAVIAIIAVTLGSCGSFGAALDTALVPEHWPETLTLTGVIAGYDRGVVAFSAPASGQINANGTFVYARSVPGTLGGFNDVADIFKDWEDAAVNNDGQFYRINALATNGPFSVGRAYSSSASRVSYGVTFIWVDREVQIRGSASTTVTEAPQEFSASNTLTIEELNLTLLAGWNAVRIERDRRIQGAGGPEPKVEVIVSARLGNPATASWTLLQ